MTTGPGRALMISPRTPKSCSTLSSALAFSCDRVGAQRGAVGRLRRGEQVERRQRDSRRSTCALGAARACGLRRRAARPRPRLHPRRRPPGRVAAQRGAGAVSKRGSARRIDGSRARRGRRAATRRVSSRDRRALRLSGHARASRARSRRARRRLDPAASPSCSSAHRRHAERQPKPAAIAKQTSAASAEHAAATTNAAVRPACRRASRPAAAAARRRSRRRARSAAARRRCAAGRRRSRRQAARREARTATRSVRVERAVGDSRQPQIATGSTSAMAASAEQLHHQIGGDGAGRAEQVAHRRVGGVAELGSCTDQVASASGGSTASADQREAAELAQAAAQARRADRRRGSSRLSKLRSIAGMVLLLSRARRRGDAAPRPWSRCRAPWRRGCSRRRDWPSAWSRAR